MVTCPCQPRGVRWWLVLFGSSIARPVAFAWRRADLQSALPSTALCAKQDFHQRAARRAPIRLLARSRVRALPSAPCPLLSASTSLLHDMVQLVSLTAEISLCTPLLRERLATSRNRETTIGARHSSQIAGQGNQAPGCCMAHALSAPARVKQKLPKTSTGCVE